MHQAARSLGLEIPDGTATCWPISADNRCRSRRSASAGSLLADRKPRLVSCNFYDSAARIAAMAVAEGAAAAVGFQDSVDDALRRAVLQPVLRDLDRANAQPKDRRTAQVTRAFVRTLDDLRSRPVS